MTKFVFILAWTLALPVFQDYPLHKGKPTSKGIEQYIEDKSDSILSEYQKFVKDTLYNVYIYADDLSEYIDNDSTELGWFYSQEIFITTHELFIAYELADLSKIQKALIQESGKFVKSTIIHELTHNYMYQIANEMRSVDQINVHRAYNSRQMLLNAQESFGRAFIEEGVCEYVSEKMGEIIVPKRPFVPKSVEDLLDKNKSYPVKYKYSAHILKSFLDARDFKKAVKVLLHNAPPSYAEILNPGLYFERLIPIDPGPSI
jgi:hypothetical protein